VQKMIIRILLTWVAGWLLAACVDAKACTPTDTWERHPANPGLFFGNKLPESNLSEVDVSMQARAKVMLDSEPVKEITKGEAGKFSNGRLMAKGSSHLRYFLVRAVRLVGGGRFTAYRHGSSIYILHGDLGAPRQAKRSVVVVAVEGEISDVFTTCSTAE
jgi:hypothetical protein